MKKIFFAAIAATVIFGSQFVAAIPASASEGSPTGVNIGFAMNWSTSNPIGSSASFLEDDGISLSNCGGSSVDSPTYRGCSFLFTTEIGGVAQDSFMDLANHNFPDLTNTTYDLAAESSFCDAQSGNPAILSNFNCFNENSYGQIFRPTTSGELTNFSMALTCLADSPISLYAVIFEVVPGVSPSPAQVSGAALGSYKIELSNCASTWQNKAFGQSDFEIVNMDFGGVQVTSGTSYGVYFAGEFVPGTQIIDVETISTSDDVTRLIPSVFSGPVIQPAGSSSFAAGSTVSFSGLNLSSISKVVIGGLDCEFVLADDAIAVKLPASLASGMYGMTVTSSYGDLVVLDALTVAASVVTTGAAQSSTKLSADGTLKVRVFEPVGAGKVQIFFNGKEIAWVNATSSADAKLTNGYLVRTLTLLEGKNVVEVFVDGERVDRKAYTK